MVLAGIVLLPEPHALRHPVHFGKFERDCSVRATEPRLTCACQCIAAASQPLLLM